MHRRQFSRLIPVAAILGLLLTVALSGSLSQPASADKGGVPNGGNSANAKLCQKDGWRNLQTSDGRTFANQGECVSAGAQGATLVPIPPPTEVPTEIPTQEPTEIPTQAPTQEPTAIPTEVPTETPTEVPTQVPTAVPPETPSPTDTPAPAPLVQVMFGHDDLRPGQCKVGAILSNFQPSTTYVVYVYRRTPQGTVQNLDWLTMQTDLDGAASSPPFSTNTYGAGQDIQLVVMAGNTAIATSVWVPLYSTSC